MAFVTQRKFLLALVPCCLGFWLAAQCGAALDSSHAWLMIAAARLLDGGRMAKDFFDPDPPMSVVAYLPPVLLHRWLAMPVFYAPYIWGALCLALSALAVRAILASWPVPEEDGKDTLLFAYLIANTVLTASVYLYFGERDQIVGLGLYPFLLVQLSMTWRYPVPRRLGWPVLAVGAVAILIKPQYGLLAVLALLHRMIVRRKFFAVMRDADFIALALAVTGYALMLMTLFPDYLSDILPGFLRFYLPQHNPQTPHIWFLYMALTVCALLLTAILGLPLEKTRLTLLSFLGSLLCLGLFLLQMKGIYYQLIPALIFFLTGLGLLLHEAAHYHFDARPWQTPAITVLLAIAAFALGAPVTSLRHADYARTPLARLVAPCAPQCTYLIFSEDIEKVSEVSLYTGAPYASRFPVLWWLPGLTEALRKNSFDTQALTLKAAYTHDAGEDFARYRPAILAIVTNLTVAGQPNFDIAGFLSADPLFRAEMLNYTKTSVLNDNRNNYFRRPSAQNDVPLIYDIYTRRP